MKHLLILFALAAMAQTTGLPQYGVLLEGTADAPVLRNNSSHRILAYAVRYDNANGATLTSFLNQVRQEMGIAPGATFAVPQPGTLGGGGGGRFPAPTQIRDARGLPVQHTSASLDAVLFEDGHLVGPDKGGMFQRIADQIKTEQDVAAVLLNATDREAAWATIQSIASSPPTSPGTYRQVTFPLPRNVYAQYLLQTRANMGEALAMKTAEHTKDYPVIVRGE